jgi:hypothetical protein
MDSKERPPMTLCRQEASRIFGNVRMENGLLTEDDISARTRHKRKQLVVYQGRNVVEAQPEEHNRKKEK